MEQGQVLDKGQRLRCGHLVARGRHAYERTNHGGESILACWPCALGATMAILRPEHDAMTTTMMREVMSAYDPDDLDALIEADRATVERREADTSMQRFREWLGQWS